MNVVHAPIDGSFNMSTYLYLFGPSQIVDKETLQEVEAIRAPVIFAVAARFGSVRLLDNMELEPST